MASATFAGSPKTVNGSFDPSSDHVTPKLGLLNLKGMPDTSALSGTNGTETKVIHGNVDFLVEKNMKLHVEQSFTELIDQHHNNTVTGNKTQSVVGVTNQTFTGHHEQTNIATRTDHFIHQRTELHSQPELVHQPTATCEHVNEKNEDSYKLVETRKEFIEIADVAFDINAIMDLATKNREMTLCYVSAEGQAFKHEIHGIRNELGAMATEIKAGKVKAAASHAKAIAANLNAGFAANADSPVA